MACGACGRRAAPSKEVWETPLGPWSFGEGGRRFPRLRQDPQAGGLKSTREDAPGAPIRHPDDLYYPPVLAQRKTRGDHAVAFAGGFGAALVRRIEGP